MSSPPENPNDLAQFSVDDHHHEASRNVDLSDNPASNSNEIQPLSTSPDAPPAEQPSQQRRASYGPSRHSYAQVSTQDDIIPAEAPLPEEDVRRTESDPLYPPPPDAYYHRGLPLRITHWGRLFITLVAVAVACLAIAAVIDVSTPSTATLEPGRDARSVADGVLAGMDRSADPCDNFYEYACGSWLRTNRIPPDVTSYSRSFSVVSDRLRLIVKDLLEGELQTTTNVTTAKAGVFYASCIEQHGVGSVNTLFLAPYRDDFNALTDAKTFTALLSRLEHASSKTLFNIYIGLDDKNPTEYAVFLGQVSLGLPHRDNYLSQEDHDVEMRRRYTKLIQTLLSAPGKAHLIPRQGHEALAKDILEFETKIAAFSLPPEDMRDPVKLYNKRLIKDLPPSLSLTKYLTNLGIDMNDINGSVVLDNPDYFDSVAQIMTALDNDDATRRVVRGYLAYHLAALAAGEGLLGEAAYTESFKFQQFVYGIKQMPEKWKTCESLTNLYLGDAVGAAFVDKFFTAAQYNVAKSLSGLIMNAFGETLKKLDWMDGITRAAAEAKLSAINWKVGYSSKMDTYDDVTVGRDTYASNVASCMKHGFTKSVNHLGKPVDKTEWAMLAQEVNAYYSAVRNEMVFPAGILQPPFFSDAYADAMNYGSIGAVIGHEMSHGFDASGRKYDKDGMLRSWWTNSSAKEYDERSKCYVDLYNKYKPRDVDIYVNGDLTLNENIADVNGVNVAYRAFKGVANNSADGLAPPNALLGRELTNDQLFFVSYAQTWCTLYRPEALKVQMMTDPHSPGQFRVLGPLSQNEGFAKAFSCRNGTRYNPVKKCHLW